MKAPDIFRRLTLVPQGVTIVVAAFLPIFAIATMFPAVPAIIDHFAGDPAAAWKVPLMVSAPGLTIAIFAPFAGLLADRVGRVRLLLCATFLYGIFGTAPFFLNDLNALFASRLLLGVTEAAILTIVNALIGDYWDDTGRRDWLFFQGLLGPFLASGVIFIAGPATALRWNGMFLVYLVAFPIFLAMWAFLFEPKRGGETVAEIAAEPAERSPFPWTWLLLVGAMTLLASALYYVFVINGGLAFREVGIADPSELSRLTALPTLFVMLGAAIFRLLGGKANAIQLGAFFLALGVGLAGIGLAVDYRWMIWAMIVQQTGSGMTVPALIAWAQTRLPLQHRGIGMGVFTSCFFFGQFSSPWLVYRLHLASGSMQGAFLWMGIFGLAIGAAAMLSLVLPGRRAAPAAA